MSKVPFPTVPIGGFSVSRPHTSPGMFAFRHEQADGLLRFPDISSIEMTPEQRREALERYVALYRPLTALVIFLNVVALEDFIRDLGVRLADVHGLSVHIPRVEGFRNPIRSYIDFTSVNRLYSDCIGIEPLSAFEIPRLSDLARVRNTVAHNGAIFRAADVSKFQYYAVTGNQLINPPIPFVKETCTYLFTIGRRFEEAVRHKILSEVMPKLDKSWVTTTPKLLLDLIEVFNYFDKINKEPMDPATYFLDDPMESIKAQQDIGKARLINLCIEELKASYPAK